MIAPIDDKGITIASPLALTDFGDQWPGPGHGWNGLAIAARHQQVIAAAMAETKAAAHGEPLGAAPIADASHRCPAVVTN